MKKWIFKDTKDNTIWETSVKEYAEDFIKLLEAKGMQYVISIQET